MFRVLLLFQLYTLAASRASFAFDEENFPDLFQELNDPNLNAGFDLEGFRQNQLDLHNYYRSIHGVQLMTRDETLTQQAQEYAEELAGIGGDLEHCANIVGCDPDGAGENLASASGSTSVETNATKAWYDEIWDYNFCYEIDGIGPTRPGHEGRAIGHFTQIVWNTSTLLGIGYARTADREKVYVVGRYKDHGNVLSQYNENVLKPDFITEKYQDNCDGTNGELTEFMGPGECSRTCGGGVQFNTKTCTNPKPSLNGRDCDGETKELVREWCNTHSCPEGENHRNSQCAARGYQPRAHNFGGNVECYLFCLPLGSTGNTFFRDGFVDDGTHCNSDRGACVNGVCEVMPLFVVGTPPPPTPPQPETTTTELEITTAEPETTTTKPETTTTEPETTTAEPETTTAEPETTTAGPETTTTQPETTTTEPETTTAEPEITTAEPETTTAEPETTTTQPETTTTEPETTTAEPQITTAEPETTTAEPETTTAEPETTTTEPDTTTAEPETTTSEPETTMSEPETTTPEPETTTNAPETTEAPEITTAAPETTTEAPETTTEAPEITTEAPETTTEAPETTTAAPETTTEAPETTTAAPETTTEAPETTTEAPETTTGTPKTTTNTPSPTATTSPPRRLIRRTFKRLLGARFFGRLFTVQNGSSNIYIHNFKPKGTALYAIYKKVGVRTNYSYRQLRRLRRLPCRYRRICITRVTAAKPGYEVEIWIRGYPSRPFCRRVGRRLICRRRRLVYIRWLYWL